MPTNWSLPQTVIQYAEPGAENKHISWLDESDFAALKSKDGRNVRPVKNLLHIARDPRHDLKDKTYFLRCTGFVFEDLPDSITGIEARISMNRFGRVTDDTVHLCLNEELIGENRASLSLELIKIFGNENDMWGTSLSLSDIQDPNFGIVVRFQSHPNWPHSSSILIDAIELRVH